MFLLIKVGVKYIQKFRTCQLALVFFCSSFGGSGGRQQGLKRASQKHVDKRGPYSRRKKGCTPVCPAISCLLSVCLTGHRSHFPEEETEIHPGDYRVVGRAAIFTESFLNYNNIFRPCFIFHKSIYGSW